MSKPNKASHAEHNKLVSFYLANKDDFADWTVITAFYSAMHYVDCKIFPINEQTDGGHKFKINNIDQYKNVKGISKDKHSIRADLVRSKCNDIYSNFEWLRSACHTARYSNYLMSNPKTIIRTAKEHLELISEFCKK